MQTQRMTAHYFSQKIVLTTFGWKSFSLKVRRPKKKEFDDTMTKVDPSVHKEMEKIAGQLKGTLQLLTCMNHRGEINKRYVLDFDHTTKTDHD